MVDVNVEKMCDCVGSDDEVVDAAAMHQQWNWGFERGCGGAASFLRELINCMASMQVVTNVRSPLVNWPSKSCVNMCSSPSVSCPGCSNLST